MTDQSWINAYAEYVLPIAWKILTALIIFMVGQWVAKLVAMVVEKVMTRAKVNPSLITFSRHVVYYALWVMVAIAALNKLGVETTSFVALVGAAGLAVGLALQGSLSNFAAGVLILIFQPFNLGDRVETTGVAGIVKEIQMFNTIVHTDDKKIVIIPNSKITGDKIIVHNKL